TDEGQRIADAERLATSSPGELREELKAIIEAEAGNLPADDRQKLLNFLMQTPAAMRGTLRRPADPSGRTLPPTFHLRQPEDLRRLLPPRPPRFAPGDRPLAGVDRELVELLGVGGFGEVWLARTPRLQGAPPVALKFCLDARAREQLLGHEADMLDQVMRQGSHPGIVRLLNTYLSAEPPCLEYEYVEGGDLTALIREWNGAGAVEPHRANEVMRTLAEIVGIAHRLNPAVVHRDLKPSNILVRKKENGDLEYRISDFGIGGLAVREQVREALPGGYTSVAAGAYSPLYSSPQQRK